MSFFNDKKIIILSPQPWSNLQISKHHYAREFAKKNRVVYVTAPLCRFGFRSIFQINNEDGVEVLSYSIPLPSQFRFKLPFIYKWYIKSVLPGFLKEMIGEIDYLFDFGCYQEYDSLDFIEAVYKIFFPVDDNPKLKGDKRGANLVLTVSKNIQSKFAPGECNYINHGLANEFSSKTIASLEKHTPWIKQDIIKVCYSGNLFSRFIDAISLETIIVSNPKIEFHFFGNDEFDTNQSWQKHWHTILSISPNVVLHGLVPPADLAEQYEKMDAFILCYRPDNKNYHGENSHKIMEYLSTGKVVVSSFISLYDKSDLIEMTMKGSEDLPRLFSTVIKEIAIHNRLEKMEKRRAYALENTYAKLIANIATLVGQKIT
ncbi:hypothetical protein WSM22_43670 [Cytophagales bacterium WSM2-2]|nr:hypothetical protein WSM22_43670 [Cytophagales bacterium WSM2-2]